MKCPKCDSQDTRVMDKRFTEDEAVNRRRRECLACGARFTTYERIEAAALKVVKKDGSREEFDEDKIREGIERSAGKRLEPKQVDALVNAVVEEVKRGAEGGEVASNAIGACVLGKLKDADEVAYLRFAAFYKEFKGAEEFQREARALRAPSAHHVESEVSQIRKRDGSIAAFDRERIVNAVFGAVKATGGHDHESAEEVADQVIGYLNSHYSDARPPGVEEIQDIVEKTLIEHGYAEVAKAYILYRKQREKERDRKFVFLDINEVMDGYLTQSDWRTKENSNCDYSFSGLMLHTAGSVIANYVLNEMYPDEIGEAHKKGYYHLHDLSCGTVGYCAGWSLKNLIVRGFNGVPNKVDSLPAKHLDVLVNQMVNFIGCVQMEFAGAQAFSSVDTLLAAFVKKDGLEYKRVKQAIQNLVFSLNIPSRWGSQMPFSNLTFDWKVPEDMKDEKAIVGGEQLEFTYGDCQAEMDLVNKAFLEVMRAGDASGRIFTFPIPTYNLTKDFDWEAPNAKLLFEVTARYGTPYFQNYIGSDLDPKSVRAMCLHPSEKIVYRTKCGVACNSIESLVESNARKFDVDGWAKPKNEVQVMGLNDDLQLEWVPVRHFLKTQVAATVKVQTEDGKFFTVSDNHPVTVVSKEGLIEKMARDLKQGDYALSIRDASNCLSKDVQKIAGEELNEELGRFLGLFVAEGCYLRENRREMKAFGKTKGLQLTFSSKEEHLINWVKEFISKRFKKEAKLLKDPRGPTVSVIMYNTNLSRGLEADGLRKHGGAPPQLWNSPKEVIQAFLQGFFEGDGYAARGEIHINDAPLAEELNLLYALVGQPTTLRIRENSQVVTIQASQGYKKGFNNYNPPLYERVPAHTVNTGKVPGLTKKKMMGLKTLDYHDAHTPQTRALKNADIYVTRVKRVEMECAAEPQTFYDVEMDSHHRFAHSLGSVTHNCCRLNIDMNQLRNKGNGLFGAGEQTGSVGVVTLNVNRIAYEAGSKAEFFEKLTHYMELAKKSLEIKREVVERNLQQGLMPYSKSYLGSFANHFSTIGLCGMNEACVNLLDKNIATPEGTEFAIETLEFMRKKLVEFQNETGHLYNLEATPAEGASYRLAKADKKAYADIYTAGTDAPYLTNSTQLPVNATDDLVEALEHQNQIQPLYTGGTVFHAFLGEKISSGEACKQLVKKIAFNTRLPYFSITPTFSVCPEHGYVVGEHFTCPCGKEEKTGEKLGVLSQ